jgi:hypothetical protein
MHIKQKSDSNLQLVMSILTEVNLLSRVNPGLRLKF